MVLHASDIWNSEYRLVTMGFMEVARILSCREAPKTVVDDGSVVFASRSCLIGFRV